MPDSRPAARRRAPARLGRDPRRRRRRAQLPARPADAGHAAPGAGQARLAGYCSPKGRLLASFVVWSRSRHDEVLAGLQRRPAAGDAEAAVDVRAARQVQAQRRQRRAAAVRAGRRRSRGWPGRSAAAGGVEPSRRRRRRPDPPARRGRSTAPRAALALGRRRARALPALALDGWRWLEVHSGVARVVGRHGGAVRAADGEPRTGGRRQFPEGLLPGPGGGGAQPVPRHAQAPRPDRAAARWRCSRARRSSTMPTRASRPAWWCWPAHGPACTTLALVELKTVGPGQRQPVMPVLRDGPPLTVAALPYAIPTDAA